VLDVGHLHHGGFSLPTVPVMRVRGTNGATIRSRPVSSEFGLQNGYKREGPTRLRYRVVEHIVLAHELGFVSTGRLVVFAGPSLRTSRARLRRRPAPGGLAGFPL